jgi:hypothetical protein
MIGITLSSEQILKAPAEVRRWVEHEVAASLGFHEQALESQRQTSPLASASQQELAAVLASIQGVFPAVNVFFELGRKGTGFAQDRLQAYRLVDIQQHTRLQSPEQVISCLDLITATFRQIRGSKDDLFYGTDNNYCFIATETQQNIRRLWVELISNEEMAGGPAKPHSGNATAVEASASSGEQLSGTDSSGARSLQG